MWIVNRPVGCEWRGGGTTPTPFKYIGGIRKKSFYNAIIVKPYKLNMELLNSDTGSPYGQLIMQHINILTYILTNFSLKHMYQMYNK